MINDALDYIRTEVRDYLGISDTQVTIGHLHTLSAQDVNPGVRLALVNVDQETSLRNLPHSQRSPSGGIEYQQPPLYVNCYVMMAFDFGTYQTDLIRLSETIELFQSRRYFDSSNERPANPFPANLERLIFDLHSADFEQLNHLWGILGGTYFPSALYKIRLVKVQANEQLAGPEITSITVNSRFKTP